jgi:hypothetical protein
LSKIVPLIGLCLFLLVGCESGLCPAIGCTPRLKMVLTGSIPDRYEVTLSAEEMTTTHFVCSGEVFESGGYESLDDGNLPMADNTVQCMKNGAEILLNGKPAELVVGLVWEGGSTETTVTPEWIANSKETECVSTCRHADITLNIP